MHGRTHLVESYIPCFVRLGRELDCESTSLQQLFKKNSLLEQISDHIEVNVPCVSLSQVKSYLASGRCLRDERKHQCGSESFTFFRLIQFNCPPKSFKAQYPTQFPHLLFPPWATLSTNITRRSTRCERTLRGASYRVVRYIYNKCALLSV